MKKKKFYKIYILTLIIILTLPGCNLFSKEIPEISIKDFDVRYKGITLNQDTPLQVLSDKLKIPIGVNDNIDIDFFTAFKKNGIDYEWLIVHYPSKKNEEITIQYIYDATKKTGKIIDLNLKTVATRRGISVGDTLEDFKAAYGNNFTDSKNTETTTYIEFNLESNGFWGFLVFENDTKKIIDISLNYIGNEALGDEPIG